jgi:drug/metabolite transporter (DMT)-like permease
MDWSLLADTAPMNGTPVAAALLLAWIVLVATVLAYVTGVLSVRRLSPQVAGVVACLEAVIATVLAWVLLGEHLSAPQIVGGLVVLVGAFIAQSSAPAKGSADPVASGGPERELSSRGTAT